MGDDSEGSFGAAPDGIRRAIEHMEAEEVRVFMDFGSTVLSAETVLEMLPDERGQGVHFVDAPFVERAFSPAVIASTGAGAGECLEAATEARTEPKLHGET